MVARIAGFAAEANQTVQFHSVQFGGLLNQINALGVVQDRLITHPCFGRSDQAVTVCRMVLKTLVPGLRRAVSTTLRMSASPSAAHMAR